jgi:hypothetical protein
MEAQQTPIQNQMRFAIACFFVFFGFGNFLLWLRTASFLHWPLMILGGLGLATASNYSRRSAFPFNLLPNLMARRAAGSPSDSAQ